MTTRNKINRRTFLKVSFTTTGSLLIGASVVGFTTEPQTPPPTPTPAPTKTAKASPTATVEPVGLPFQPNLFIRIDRDGSITLIVHRSEMGQGVRTALAMILAEELEADWATIQVEQSLANTKIGEQSTGGSGTISNFYGSLREAGARTRQMLIAAAAESWGVTVEECYAEASAVIHTASGKRLGYGELVDTVQAMKMPRFFTRLKEPEIFRLIGTSVPRIDEPAIVTGQAIYGLDVRLPGMSFATIARCPVPGGKLIRYDDTQAKRVAGVQAVVTVPSSVAVVATHSWAAIEGRAALQITWDEGDNADISSASIREQLVALMDKAIAQEPPAAASSTEAMIEAIYETPYLAHAPMEPMNCVAMDA